LTLTIGKSFGVNTSFLRRLLIWLHARPTLISLAGRGIGLLAGTMNDRPIQAEAVVEYVQGGRMITEGMGGIADMCLKRLIDTESEGLKGWRWMVWGKSMNGRKSGEVGGWSNCDRRVEEYPSGLEM
jgi:hypothetical protein